MEDLFAEEFDLEQMEAETEAMLALNYLDRSNSTFHRTEGGFVSLDTQEKHYNRVQVFRTFPFTGKNMYISIREPDEKAKEIGVHMSGNAVVHLTETRLLITDLDENRFEIPDTSKLTGKELKKIGLFL